MHLVGLNSELYIFPVERKLLASFLSDYRESGSKTDLPVIPFPEVSKVKVDGE